MGSKRPADWFHFSVGNMQGISIKGATMDVSRDSSFSFYQKISSYHARALSVIMLTAHRLGVMRLRQGQVGVQLAASLGC